MPQRFLLTWFIGVLVLGLTGRARAQPVVSNIRVETDARRLRVTYDLKGVIDQDSIYLQIESRSRGLLRPQTVTGDVGRHITAGVDKVIYWDFALDGERISDEIRPTVGVIIPPYSGPPVGGGPASALLSVLVPGLGTIRVQPTHRVGLRPLITAGYAGLLVYGLVKRSSANRQYALYTAATFERDARPHYDEANRLHKLSALAIDAAVVVMVADVVYTFIKGTQNARKIRKFQQRLTIQSLDNTPVVGMRLTF